MVFFSSKAHHLGLSQSGVKSSRENHSRRTVRSAHTHTQYITWDKPRFCLHLFLFSKPSSFAKFPVPLKSIFLRIVWFCTRVPAKFVLYLLCVYKVRPRSEENLLKKKRGGERRTMTTTASLLMFGNVSATERKQRRRKVSEPSALLKKMNSKTVSAPNWMRTERTDMHMRFEAASAKNAEAMTSNRDGKHLYVFVHGLASEDDLLALATER